MYHYHLNIGSNLGDSEKNIRLAVAMLQQQAVVLSSVIISDVYISEPWGFDSDNKFYNIGMSFDAEIGPLALLKLTQKIEKDISSGSHRDATGNYIDREIDIDIIAAATTNPLTGNLTLLEINTPQLILPHPRAHLRDFVLHPLHQSDPIISSLINIRKQL